MNEIIYGNIVKNKKGTTRIYLEINIFLNLFKAA